MYKGPMDKAKVGKYGRWEVGVGRVRKVEVEKWR